MQSLLQAVLNQFEEWPAPTGSDLFFSCDIDGEVRQQGEWVSFEGSNGTELDFYPSIPVRREDCTSWFEDYLVYVTEQDFKTAVSKINKI